MSLIPTPTRRITPVILSGGSGTRLWPESRTQRPKQFLKLTDADRTMLQLTVARCADQSRFAPPLIISGESHLDYISAQLEAAGIDDYRVVAEPSARNTAPALALAALALAEPDSLMLVMPSDHEIANQPAFLAAIDKAATLALDHQLVTFGISPTHPETGYGYIQMGVPYGEGAKVARFVEKPERAAAEAMLAQGGYVWNAGLFLFSNSDFLRALDQFEPDIGAACRAAMKSAHIDGRITRPDAAAFNASPSISVDYAVMERADNVAVVPVDMGWSDIGSWQSLHALSAQDEAGNAVTGDGLLLDARGNLVRAGSMRVSLIGLEGYAVIVDGNDVVIAPLNRSQDIKKLAEQRD